MIINSIMKHERGRKIPCHDGSCHCFPAQFLVLALQTLCQCWTNTFFDGICCSTWRWCNVCLSIHLFVVSELQFFPICLYVCACMCLCFLLCTMLLLEVLAMADPVTLSPPGRSVQLLRVRSEELQELPNNLCVFVQRFCV